jgi:hypothetical protein
MEETMAVGDIESGWGRTTKSRACRIAHSVGFVRHPDGAGGYVMAVLTIEWSSWTAGVPAVNEISGWGSEAMTG